MGNVSVEFVFFLTQVKRSMILVSFQCKLLTPPLFSDSLNQILFFSGVTLTIGFKSSMQFFMKRQNFKVTDWDTLPLLLDISCMFFFPLTIFFTLLVQGTISFGVGFFFVIIGWPIIGMILEAYGFIVLFRYVGYVRLQFQFLYISF